jgi:hypothetical protein
MERGRSAMPIDDLDRLLEMELGGSPEGRKISDKVSSLEAQVLNRIQQSRPSPPQSGLSAESPAKTEESKPPVDQSDPIYGYADAILPLVEALQGSFEATQNTNSDDDFSSLRSQMAEKLLALPEVESINKAAMFAAMAMCIDAANSKDAEARSTARKRLDMLISALGRMKTEIDGLRAKAIDDFLVEGQRSKVESQ